MCEFLFGRCEKLEKHVPMCTNITESSERDSERHCFRGWEGGLGKYKKAGQFPFGSVFKQAFSFEWGIEGHKQVQKQKLPANAKGGRGALTELLRLLFFGMFTSPSVRFRVFLRDLKFLKYHPYVFFSKISNPNLQFLAFFVKS